MKIFKYLAYIFLFTFFGLYTFGASTKADTTRIKQDLKTITKTSKSRSYLNIDILNQVAEYIYKELSKTCDTVYYQTYLVNGNEYKNVIGSIGTKNKERIVVGAHYDVADDQEGADDNASGVVGVLELSRLLFKQNVNYRIDFVAFSLEEPPFFRSQNMGSYVHAKSLFDNNIELKGMICLEMIGYFNDNPRSQNYPLGLFKLFYGNKGDFITVVQKPDNGKFGKQVKKLMKKEGIIKTKSFTSPAFLPGVDFSDHRNYWKFGYSAVMITNTAFFRNQNYHQTSDKLETLDIRRMALVIDEIYEILKKL